MEKSSRRNRNESSGSGLKNDIHDESEVPVLQRASKKRRHSFREELEEGKDGGRLPLAPRLEVFGKDPKSYRPRNEWFRLTNDEPITTTVRDALFHTTRNRTAAMVSTVTTTATGTPTSLPLFPKVSFGDDRDSAVHYCIRSDYFDAARKLISEGPCRLIHVENLKGMTPIILAAQSGNLAMVQYLHELGANTSHVSVNGSTTALQAAHFGHLHVLKFILGINSGLLEQSNQHKTTPLMRASQENHLSVVKFLCELGAGVNGKNLQGMTALMLASQRGNAEVCRYLIQHGADVDAMTERSSTSLIFACKGEHLQTVQVLVCGGAELFIKDGRGRTPREICLHRISHPTQPTSNPETIQKIVSLLDPLVQVDLMRCQARSERSFSWIRLWTLLQEDRARLRGVEDRQFHDAVEIAGERDLFSPTDMAWFRMLCLPAPLVRHIAEFCPLPNHFGRRLSLLFKRCSHDANSALVACFDIIDEVLEERGFLQALDQALIPPPAAYSSWVSLFNAVLCFRQNCFHFSSFLFLHSSPLCTHTITT